MKKLLGFLGSRGRRDHTDNSQVLSVGARASLQIRGEDGLRAATAAKIIVVNVDGDERLDLKKRFSLNAYPTMILLSPEGLEIRRARGYRSVASHPEQPWSSEHAPSEELR